MDPAVTDSPVSAVLPAEVEQAIKWLEAAAADGLGGVGSPADATVLFAGVERLGRLAEVVAVDAVEAVDAARAHYDHGHVDAETMFKHVSGCSGHAATRVRKLRKMLRRCELIDTAWRSGELNADRAAVLARAFANVRVRDRFCEPETQAWMLDLAGRLSHQRFCVRVAEWVNLHDQDGPAPEPDPSHERRDAKLAGGVESFV